MLQLRQRPRGASVPDRRAEDREEGAQGVAAEKIGWKRRVLMWEGDGVVKVMGDERAIDGG